MKDLYEMEREKNIDHYRTEADNIYRHGYYDGFISGRTQPHININEVRNWMLSLDQTIPPGSRMEEVPDLDDLDL